MNAGRGWPDVSIQATARFDHTCRMKFCVNPDHLEAVTSQENTRRGGWNKGQFRMKTHCKRGHLLHGENLGIDHRGHAKCRACAKIFKATKRPYIPRSTRVDVLLRQCEEHNLAIPQRQKKTLAEYIKTLQFLLFGDEKVHLDHDPALVNRIFVDGVYSPDANDPRFLAYLPVQDHRTKTYVRGLNGAHSDLALARKQKRIEKKRDKRPHKGVATRPELRHGSALKGPKRKWPSRPFPKGRKFNNRSIP